MEKLLLNAIGVSNFKSFDSYTYIPIKELTILIGKNGSGKSSFWHVLRLLNCFNIHFKEFIPDKYSLVMDQEINLENYNDIGNIADTLLFNPLEPLIIEVYTKYLIDKYIIDDEELVYRFCFNKNQNNQLLLTEFSLLRGNSKEILLSTSYLNDSNLESIFEISDYLSQYFFDILFKIQQKKYKINFKDGFILNLGLPNKNVEILESFVKDKPKEYFMADINYTYILSPSSRFSNYLSVLIQDSLNFLSDNIIEEKKENLVICFNILLDAFKSNINGCFKQISKTIFVSRQLIGYPTRFIDVSKEINDLLEIDPKKSDIIDFIKSRLNYFGFIDPPVFSLDQTQKFYYLKQGSQDLRNTGSGYWSIAFLIHAIINAVHNNRNLIILEEPEAHLHPDFQVLLADFLIEISEKFKLTLILETHSEYIARRIQLRVFAAHNDLNIDNDPNEEARLSLLYNNPYNVKIEKEKVIFNYFKHTTEKLIHTNNCINITVDNSGKLSEEYPKTFAGVANADALNLFNLQNS
jgi:predicted ATP-dependent endonuclease of OLD family